MMLSLTTVALLVAVPALVYLFLVWNFNYWRKRGVKTAPSRPLLGSFPNLLTQKDHLADDMNAIYKRYKASDRFVGVFLMRTPQLMLLHPDLIHDVFVTHFKHFQDNDVAKLLDAKKDPLVAKNPFVLSGQEWKEQRALISPGLTSTRIKVAYSVTQEVCWQLCQYIEEESKVCGKNGINGKDLALRFTSENVADCVLGLKAKSFSDERIPIAENVRIFSENNTIFLIYSIMAGLFPSLINVYKAKFFPAACEQFFLKLMKQAFSMRAANKVARQDFLNHIMSLREKKHLNDIELASHSMTFLIDGLDTSATAISHALLLLARYPEVQQKLRKEIRQNLDDDNGELSFEKINELPYLDACFHESVRIFPPGVFSTKVCTEAHEFTNSDGHCVKLQVGDTVMLPLYAIHHDADYYPEPEEFKPERFMPENGGLKKYRDMGVYLGFGDGPRMCLGMRFALVQSKAAIASIVKRFNITVNPKTKDGNRLDPKAFLAVKDGGVWLDFEKV